MNAVETKDIQFHKQSNVNNFTQSNCACIVVTRQILVASSSYTPFETSYRDINPTLLKAIVLACYM